MAIWALSQLLPRAQFVTLAESYAAQEPDTDVAQEWNG
jgi:hypothetical protein